MKLVLVLVVSAAAVAAVSALPTFERGLNCLFNSGLGIYEDKIRQALEKLREQLRQGIPDKGIPPMDPLQLHNLDLKLNVPPYVTADWNMTEGNITGLLGFELTHIVFKIAGFKFEYGLNFPAIAGLGLYGIDGLLGEVLPVYGSGAFDVLATNFSFVGNGKMGYQDEHFTLQQFTCDMELAKFKFNVTGLMDDPDLNSVVSHMLSDSLPHLIKEFHRVIGAEISAVVMKEANDYLKNHTIPFPMLLDELC